MTFHYKIDAKARKNELLCVAGFQIRKLYINNLVYRINFKIRNFKIQTNYTAKVKVVRDSPNYRLHFTLSHRRIRIVFLGMEREINYLKKDK